MANFLEIVFNIHNIRRSPNILKFEPFPKYEATKAFKTINFSPERNKNHEQKSLSLAAYSRRKVVYRNSGHRLVKQIAVTIQNPRRNLKADQLMYIKVVQLQIY